MEKIPKIDKENYRIDFNMFYGDPPFIIVTCPYCNEKHPKNICNNPDVIKFSEYLLNLFKELYQLDESFEIKQETAYNMLNEYSIQLLVASSSRISLPLCKYKTTFYGKKNSYYKKKDLINELMECMFQYIIIKYPQLKQGIIPKASFAEKLKNIMPSKIEYIEQLPSAPPIQKPNIFNDIYAASAPPSDKMGGKQKNKAGKRRNKTRKQKNKPRKQSTYKKHLTRKNKRRY